MHNPSLQLNETFSNATPTPNTKENYPPLENVQSNLLDYDIIIPTNNFKANLPDKLQNEPNIITSPDPSMGSANSDTQSPPANA